MNQLNVLNQNKPLKNNVTTVNKLVMFNQTVLNHKNHQSNVTHVVNLVTFLKNVPDHQVLLLQHHSDPVQELVSSVTNVVVLTILLETVSLPTLLT
ncbi:unnamed protein product [[Candida] boidinii]|nr:unnamed protein product [[Candida] boidinii]